MEKFYFIENWAYFPLFVDVEAGITLSDGSSNGNIIESDSERLSDHSGDDSNESVESVMTAVFVSQKWPKVEKLLWAVKKK